MANNEERIIIVGGGSLAAELISWILNANIYKSIDTGVLTLFSIYNMYPGKVEIKKDNLSRLWGNDILYKKLQRGVTVEKLLTY